MTSSLVNRIRGGDVAAFEQLFRELHAPLCEVVDSYVRSQSVAEEIVQELFFVVWMKRERLREGSVRGYLFSSARNRALHHLRHQSVVRRWSQQSDIRPEVSGLGQGPAGADEVTESDERRRAVRRAIDRLPARSRLAFLLRWEHKMSNEEVAGAMDISIKGVEKLVTIARRHLRAALGAHSDRDATLGD
jgi:RNA polymerase sigma-70 factor (ECF subfamily)